MKIINIDGTDKSGKTTICKILSNRLIKAGYKDLNPAGKSGALIFRGNGLCIAMAPDGRHPQYIKDAYTEITKVVSNTSLINYLFLTSRTKGKTKHEIEDIIKQNIKLNNLTTTDVYTIRTNTIQPGLPGDPKKSLDGNTIEKQKTAFLDFTLEIIGLTIKPKNYEEF